MGSNMAECHPVAFRWPMKAKLNGAKLVHVDPRFTRTSAVADLHVPIRAGSDIAFLGGLINYVVNSKRWNTDPFFKEFAVNYTNAATIINDDFKDTEDLDGVFSGMVKFTEPAFWPYNGLEGRYDNATWAYKRGPKPPPGAIGAVTAGEMHRVAPGTATKELIAKRAGPPFDDLVRSLKPGPAERDPTLQSPHCVFQILKRHFSRYTPEMVEQVCGSPKEKFIKVAEMLRDYMAAETSPTSYYGNTPKFLVSYLKSMYGAAATAENDFGYDWHPKILGDHSHIATFAAMADGKVKGMCCVGQNPATSLNGAATRLAMRQLDWLVVKDNWLTETATHWYLGPEVKSGEVKIADIKTEIFFFPSTQIAEYDGSFTNTQRMLQWHHKASDAPGDCRTDTWFYHNLAKRMKKLYAGSKLPRDQGWSNVTWDFDPDPGVKAIYPGEPDALKILREINGYQTADATQHLKGFAELKDDGSTTCASWIYCGCYPAPDH